MQPKPPIVKGRGTDANPANRFERLSVVHDHEDDAAPTTHFFNDVSKSILSENDSPDLPFRFSVNPYRGCEHGCVYCYARPSHEYLGFSAGLDFETQIMVKAQAPELLRKALMHPNWKATPISFSGNTDCYQPGERKLRLTRACLDVCAEFLQPVSIITKNALVRRDIDILQKLAAANAVHVYVSLTTLDQELAAKMEPRASRPQQRLDAIRALSDAAIPVGVMTAPIIPGLNDREIPALLQAAQAHGARAAGWVMLRLAKPLDSLFEDWLVRQYPTRADKVMARIRDVRGGKTNDTAWGSRQRGEGTYAEQIDQLFGAAAKKHGLDEHLRGLNCEAFARPDVVGTQLKLF